MSSTYLDEISAEEKKEKEVVKKEEEEVEKEEKAAAPVVEAVVKEEEAAKEDSEVKKEKEEKPVVLRADREAAYVEKVLVEAVEELAGSVVAEVEAAADKPKKAKKSLRKRDALKNAVTAPFTAFRRSKALDKEAEDAAAALLDEDCEVVFKEDEPVVAPVAEECVDEGLRKRTVERLSKLIKKTVAPKVKGKEEDDEGEEEMETFGEQLEAGWAKRGSGSSLRRNVEVR